MIVICDSDLAITVTQLLSDSDDPGGIIIWKPGQTLRISTLHLGIPQGYPHCVYPTYKFLTFPEF